jgi:CheY-like chemotaxis protein
MNTSLRPKILIVEDDHAILSGIADLLTDGDFEVVTATNGQAAIEILKNSVIKPNLILLDLMMPIMDGFEFRKLQLLDPLLRDIPVVVMSADGHVEEKRVRTQAGAYLKKPVDIFVLMDTVRKHATKIA